MTRCVLAYSGGLDTSVAIRWLAEHKGYEIVACAIGVGQVAPGEMERIRQRALDCGAVEAVEKGVATSWSLMMPCPWVPEIARYLKEHPDMDSGLHLTLTSEWALYRWGPLAGKSQVPGLVDHEGCLWRSIEQVARKATPDEVEREIRAQIDRAESLGLPVTHLDSHMGALFARPDYFERFVKVGIEKGIPILAVGGHMTHVSGRYREAALKLRPWVKRVWNGGLPVIDDLGARLQAEIDPVLRRELIGHGVSAQ